MTNLTQKFDALETQLDAADTAMQTDLNAMREQLELLNSQIDTININNAVNARAILQAIAANDPCGCAGDPSLIIPPIGTVPIGISSDQCKRIQAFLHTMQEIFTVLDVASAFSVGLNFTLVYNSINEVINSIESGVDLPVISYAEATLLINDIINYIIGNIAIGGTLSAYFSTILLDLRDGMSLSTSAEAAQSAYNAVVAASALPEHVQPVIQNAAYRALYSYYFDPSSTPNLTGYDGGLCGAALADLTICTDFLSVEIMPSTETFFALQVPVLVPALGPTAIEGNYQGWTFQAISGEPAFEVKLYYWTGTDGPHFSDQMIPGEPPLTMEFETIAIAVQTNESEPGFIPFTVRICPPS